MPQHEPIAIIGTACRFPGGSSSPGSLWELLKNPRDLLKEIPSSRFNAHGFYHKDGDHHGATNVIQSYLLDEDHRAFDASFFNISPREAEAMDPQQRYLLEVVYEAIEGAGYPIDKLRGSDTSVSVGVMTGDYHDLQLRDISSIPQHLATGTSRSILSNRISYFFDWKGPSLTIDTACSSSLVAVHQAITSIRQGSPIAVAAGANLILGPETFIFESKLHMLSPTGRSRMWDDRADGYARGEGFAAVVLKPLSKAIQDGDHIETIIRASGSNQDGYGPKGLTMPVAESQLKLIERTYADAGLDPKNPCDRCQYFEAHGTGTLAGDPVEAEAVSRAFFSAGEVVSRDKVLHLGSIKTVIGHLEGTAGLAGLIKSSLAVQHGIIPANLLFKKLNPTIKPFYTNLKVPTEATPWPELPSGVPRRVSVNSFGFGGTNAHVIIESYTPSNDPAKAVGTDGTATALFRRAKNKPVLPLILSANSEYSMIEMVRSYSKHLSKYPRLDLASLNWTSIVHRSMFQYRLSFPASELNVLQDAMSRKISELETSRKEFTRINSRPNMPKSQLLGIFTGQGAQWPGMGASLIKSCRMFAQSIQSMDEALADLPDGPSWTLMEELQAPSDKTKIHESAISQPACTALQIALVDLLNYIGISFSVVVGHSSGEIAAAYTTGCISAKDAIRIAYYRGIHTQLAGGLDMETGGMMAVGYSFNQATIFCEQDQWEGRLVVAASNGPRGTTLSGDYDAIIEAKEVLEEEGTFTRILKVDKAYHSHHMNRCGEPYVKSLNACGIKSSYPSTGVWVSSVRASGDFDDEAISALSGPYWKENMANPVLFSQAVTQALKEYGSFDAALEIGPHAALAGPVIQTAKDLDKDVSFSYHGVLHRNQDDITSISAALGSLLTTIDRPQINLKRYAELFANDDLAPLTFLKGLPSYPWNHEKLFWKESRVSERFRLRQQPINELLGVRSPDDNDDEIRWRNTLRLQELPWASGHCFQHQVLFPAAGYVSMAVEASASLAKGEEIRTLILSNLQILKAITLEETAGVEILFTLSKEEMDVNDDRTIKGHFALYARTKEGSKEMDKHFSGNMTLKLGDLITQTFSVRSRPQTKLRNVDVGRFYESLSSIGLDYSDAFRGITAIDRQMNVSQIEVSRMDHRSRDSRLLVHPAFLDSCLQGLFAAFAAPDDGTIWTTYLPTSIHKAVFSLGTLRSVQSETAHVDCYVTNGSPLSIVGDIEIFNSRDHMQIQLEGLKCDAIAKATINNDRKLFAKVDWELDTFGSFNDEVQVDIVRSKEGQIAEICERLSYFYLRNLRARISPQEQSTMKWHFQRLLAFTDHVLPLLESGAYPTVDPQWIKDDEHILDSLPQGFSDDVDVQIVQAVGSNLVDIVRGQKETLEVMRENNMLNRLYIEGIGTHQCNEHVSGIVRRISHRYPHMKILEIGAGTGGTTRYVAKGLGHNFSQYYYTDISTGFFERARGILDGSKTVFMTLDIEKDPMKQGFEASSFEMIVASNVLHATKFLKETMKRVRSLLKPGGHLLLLETTGQWLRSQFVMCGLPGWWLGFDDGRKYAPIIAERQWHSLLQNTGYSGLDLVARDSSNSSSHSISVMLTQAVDERVEALRQPLAFPDVIPKVDRFIILGGDSLRTSWIIRDIQKLLRPWNNEIEIQSSVENVTTFKDSGTLAILSLIDFDDPYFHDRTVSKLEALQNMLGAAKYVVWASHGSRTEKPFANMMVGLARTLRHEIPDLMFQILDIEDTDKEMTVPQTANHIATTVLRLILSSSCNLTENTLWSNEPELLIKGGKIWIPRVNAAPKLNDRLNSARRKVKSNVDLERTQIQIYQKEATRQWSIRAAQNGISKLIIPEGHILIQLKFSLMHSIRVLAGSFFFVCFGEEVGTGRRMIALSQSRTSAIVIPVSWATICQVNDEEAPRYLWEFACCLIGRSIIEASPVSAISLVHEPDQYLRTILSTQANQAGMDIRYTRTHSSLEIKDDSIVIQPLDSTRRIRAVLPQNVSSVFDMSDSAETYAAMAKCAPHIFWHPISWTFGIRSILCPDCSSLSIEKILSEISGLLNLPGIVSEEKCTLISSNVKTQVNHTLCATLNSHTFPDSRVIPAAAFANNDPPRVDPFTIISWGEPSTTVPVCVDPVDATKLFSHEKTYLLVGLTGELGQSLARYMVINGAKHIVLTSRNPQVHSQWLVEMETLGAIIKIIPLDISNRTALKTVVKNVRSTMPPIGGVANAAMVLSDQTFIKMSHDQLEKVLLPKVNGSRYLDEIFYSDKSLDFFVLFSSLAAVVGNRGQANYNIANMFQASLARQRRRRGVVASVMNIGMIIGLGYLSRFGTKYEEIFQKMNFMPISEHELHIIFAEAINAGRSRFEDDCEMIVGLQEATGAEDAENPPAWFKDPRFSNLIHTRSAVTDSTASKKNTVSVAEKLGQATNYSEVRSILEDALTTSLGLMLHMSRDQLDVSTPLTGLGIDSLIAVDLRTWLHTQLQVDIPIFKLLSGSSVLQLCADIVPKLGTELLPKIDKCDFPKDMLAESHTKGYSTMNKDDSTEKIKPLIAIQSTETPQSNSRSTASDNRKLFAEAESPDSFPSSTAITGSTSSMRESVSTDDGMNILRKGKASVGQSSLLFVRDYLRDKSASNVGIQFTLRGPLDIKRFENAIDEVIAKHEILRTAFSQDVESKNHIQMVLEHSSFKLQHKTLSSDHDVRLEHEKLMTAELDLSHGNTIAAVLIKRSTNIHEVIFCYHHVVLDGLSWRLFVDELHRAYSGHGLLPLSFHQIDFAQKEEEAIRSGQLISELAYWKNEFSQLPETSPLLPISKVPCRHTLEVYNTSTVSLNLDINVAARIRKASKALNVTPFQFYLSTLQVLLFKLVGTTDQCIGIVDANRSELDFVSTMGYFINMLALRLNVNESHSFHEVITQARKKVHLAMENSRLPFGVLLDELKVPRSTAHSPLFQILMNYRLGALEQEMIGDCELTGMEGTIPKTPYDMTLLVTESSKGYSVVQLDVQKYLYSDDDTHQVLLTYAHLLDTFSSDPSTKIKNCSAFSPTMTTESLNFAHGNISLDLDRSETLLNYISQHFSHNNSIAINDGYGQIISYGDLKKRVHTLVSTLKAAGIGSSAHVALLCEPSADFVCALLAIWYRGATCIPLDLSNPTARLDAIIKECRPLATIFHEQSHDIFSHLSSKNITGIGIQIPHDIETSDLGQEAIKNLADSDTPAFILYTSGTTGKPKGISLTHLNITNSILGIRKCLNLHQETVLQQSSLGFDLSAAQILIAIAGGGTLIIPKRELRGDAIELSKLILLEQVTLTFCVPSEYSVLLRFGNAILKQCSNWKIAMSAGEKMTSRIKKNFRDLESSVRLVNAYGPAETTIISHLANSSYKLSEVTDEGEEFETVGRSLPNFSTYILDKSGNQLPLGFPGEICIGGPSVSPGYSHNDALNQQKFVPNPFSSRHEKELGWDRLYRSGDQGRLLKDGSLVPLGRIDGDQQIKLRGMRVELGSIESSILTTARGVISDAVVVERGQPIFLVGFVTFVEEKRPADPDNFLYTLIEDLPEPEYMRPTIIVPLEKIPQGPNGKTDRNALKRIVVDRNPKTKPTDNESLTANELKLSQLWRSLLFENEAAPLNIYKHTDFFTVGGTSLLLVELQHLLQQEIRVEIPLQSLFQASSLHKMSRFLVPDAVKAISRIQIDWTEETSISHDLLNTERLLPAPNKNQGIRVALTGASGFLGTSLLRRLIDLDSVSEIYCLAVRHKDGSPSRAFQTHSEKVKIYSGDLSIPLLGLSEDSFNYFCHNVDVIIHNGAEVSFLKTYSDLRASNVSSTKNLVRLSLLRRVPLHFISTAGVAQLVTTDVPLTESMTASALSNPREDTDGYVSSKWVSERYLENATKKLGSKVFVHRPSYILGNETISTDVIGSLLEYSRKMSKVPLLRGWKGDFDFVSMRTVVNDVVGACLQSVSDWEHGDEAGRLQVQHLCGEVKVPLNQLKEYVSGEDGRHVEEVELEEWIREANLVGLPKTMGMYLENLVTQGMRMPIIEKIKAA
ncbi:putative polyketide synthase protein [Botrytis fragariae]|uniref:Putative polyketide synthase protein n=1 Tax=Botrytis fragariae TaxID=1964551 RepID=A0A8H6EN77_9HELO|nr:putative polyketide synthase protein [Botrytis fragariae]KAF5878447.1 putative polyketide synthase protein [Botrytis fragariae]